MADPEIKDSATPEPKAATPVIDEAKLAAGIAEGLKATLSEMGRREDAPPVRASAPSLPAIEDVTEESIFEAMEQGDRAKAASLMRKARSADRQRIERESLSPILSNGVAALSSMARELANNLPYYQKYKKEIDGEIDRWQAQNPGAAPSVEHFKAARDIVVGRHAAEIEHEAREAGIRQAREPEPELIPSHGRHLAADEPVEPTTLDAVLTGNWKQELKEKSRKRSDDEEMAIAGFGDTMGFLAARKNLAQIKEETNGSFGLDAEWSHADKRWLTPDESRRLSIRGE